MLATSTDTELEAESDPSPILKRTKISRRRMNWNYCILSSLLASEYKLCGLFTCARTCYSNISHTASIRERRLFRSVHPEVRQQFESGD